MIEHSSSCNVDLACQMWRSLHAKHVPRRGRARGCSAAGSVMPSVLAGHSSNFTRCSTSTRELREQFNLQATPQASAMAQVVVADVTIGIGG
jgi:hypothetical protein